MTVRARIALSLLACCAVPLPSQAPPTNAPMIGIGHIHHLQSAALGEERKYFVYETTGPRGRALPTIFVLDADAQFLHTATSVRFLYETGRMPAARVVGIPNTADRTRDLTPALASERLRRELPTAGGATRMLGFIGDELVPAIERVYGKAPMRVLVGHSLGGITAVHAMLARPGLFHALVMVSPSLWLDDYRFTDSLLARMANPADASPWVFATVGSLEDRVQVTPFRRIVDALRLHPRAGWQFREMPGEDHGTTPLRTTYDALQALFAQIGVPRDSSRLLGVEGIDRRYAELRKRFGYPDHTPEAALNTLGYELLADSTAAGRAAAVAAFRENTRRFPHSANTYDSLGDALRAQGDSALALACYAAAVQLATDRPTDGETFANALITPGATTKLNELATRLGRTASVTALAPGCRQ